MFWNGCTRAWVRISLCDRKPNRRKDLGMMPGFLVFPSLLPDPKTQKKVGSRIAIDSRPLFPSDSRPFFPFPFFPSTLSLGAHSFGINGDHRPVGSIYNSVTLVMPPTLFDQNRNGRGHFCPLAAEFFGNLPGYSWFPGCCGSSASTRSRKPSDSGTLLARSKARRLARSPSGFITSLIPCRNCRPTTVTFSIWNSLEALSQQANTKVGFLANANL